ncbi:MAG: polyprenol monophosphomannose synthase [Planctomycetota bacterium]|nr:polyprenol monophosphomannose synthase [Planctomycetota bacterium]
MSSRLIISLATYNESGNLRALVEEIRRCLPEADILVIDDNSPDGTGKIADELSRADRSVHVLHRPGKMGLGTAVLAGMRYAIENGYEYLINMDADFSHPPRYLQSLLAGAQGDGLDVMIGSRYVAGGGIAGEQFNFKRKFMSGGINAYARFWLGLKSRDNSGSYRCYRTEMLKRIPFEKIRSRGYSFMEEILYWCLEAGAKIGETPILFENRRAGASKINKMEAVNALRIIAELGVGRALGRNYARAD